MYNKDGKALLFKKKIKEKRKKKKEEEDDNGFKGVHAIYICCMSLWTVDLANLLRVTLYIAYESHAQNADIGIGKFRLLVYFPHIYQV